MMSAAEKHYRLSLVFCRKEGDQKAYQSLLPVVYKWIEDAYLEYGLEMGSSKIRWDVLSSEEFEDERNEWRRKDLDVSALIRGFLPASWVGDFRFFEYFLRIVPSGENLHSLHHGAMPPTLLYFLYHYLSHCNSGCEVHPIPVRKSL